MNIEAYLRQIDIGHKTLIACFESLKQTHALCDLNEFAVQCFSTEENIMHEYGYASAFEHTKKHIEITNEIAKINRFKELAPTMAVIRTLSILDDLINNHIPKYDTPLLDWLKEKIQ